LGGRCGRPLSRKCFGTRTETFGKSMGTLEGLRRFLRCSFRAMLELVVVVVVVESLESGRILRFTCCRRCLLRGAMGR